MHLIDEQPAPVPNGRPSTWGVLIEAAKEYRERWALVFSRERLKAVDALIADMVAREREGVRRYGTVLQHHNGRCSLVDAYHSTLDRLAYLKNDELEGGDKTSPFGVPLVQRAFADCVELRMILAQRGLDVPREVAESATPTTFPPEIDAEGEVIPEHETFATIAEWQRRTFGEPSGPPSSTVGLRVLEEAVELCVAMGARGWQVESACSAAIVRCFDGRSEHDPAEEAVDVVIRCVHALVRIGVDPQTVVDVKMRINRGRTWEPNGDGTAQHTDRAADSAASDGDPSIDGVPSTGDIG